MNTQETAPLILVVEDEPALRHDLVEELHEAGYRTLVAEDGEDALARLAGHSPDLVLCDVTMPKLDGYELLATLRAERPDLIATPFVFLTAMSEPQEVIKGKLQGADDYLVKPVDYDLLLATVSARLRQVANIRGHHRTQINNLRVAIQELSLGVPQQAFDLISLGVVLLDEHGNIAYANHTARQLAHDAEFLTIQANAPHAADPRCDKALHHAICEAIETARRGEDLAIGVILDGTEKSLPALVCTLSPNPANENSQPHAVLFVPPPTRSMRVSEKLLIELYDFTPTEARVAAILARGGRPAEVADALAISATTVAFHIRNLLQKTRTNRQTDLIALLLAGPMAVQIP